MTEEALLYLETAYNDCLAAEKLYKSKFYSQSIFYVNQSVEKICKYYAIRNDLVSPSEVRSLIGHNSTKVFTKILRDHFLDVEKNWSNNLTKSSYDFTPFFKQFHSEMLGFENYSKVKDISNLTDTSIILLLHRLDSLDKVVDMSSPLDNLFKDPRQLIKELFNWGVILETDLTELEKDKAKYDRFLLELNKILNHIPNYQQTVAKLILVTTIFSNNLNVTRYPNLDLMKRPDQIFNKNNNLVTYLPRFLKHIFSIIKTLKGFNEIKI